MLLRRAASLPFAQASRSGKAAAENTAARLALLTLDQPVTKGFQR